MELDHTTKYILQSVHSGSTFPDTGWILDAPGEQTPTLVRAIYEQKKLTVMDDGFGMYRFADWLPIRRILHGSSAPVTYKSRGLAAELGLEELYITFSGYWPERNAMMRTCSFKETEAFSVCARLDPDMMKVLVVASAGNTARAFARVCSDNYIPLLLCVPRCAIRSLWFDQPIRDCVKLAVTAPRGDYFDAIEISNQASSLDGYLPEGGAKNIARRDGMGTTVLSATTHIGRIPDYYFQAVGSGTGAIAAWEANLRLIEDGRFGNHKMKLVLSQNIPFHPMYDAWQAGSRDLLPLDDEVARSKVEKIMAQVLSNRRPPFSLAGGVYDALADTGGEMMLVANDEAFAAADLFARTEGIDIHPAAAVATASLVHAVRDNRIPSGSVVMLNITGGGEERFRKENKLYFLKPVVRFGMHPSKKVVERKLGELFTADWRRRNFRRKSSGVEIE
ncbi:MAG TPA: cysteate synthase [Bacteroidales bacterium]|nr:cysteate synthase [Bacteroidales bacterium]